MRITLFSEKGSIFKVIQRAILMDNCPTCYPLPIMADPPQPMPLQKVDLRQLRTIAQPSPLTNVANRALDVYLHFPMGQSNNVISVQLIRLEGVLLFRMCFYPNH